MVRAHSKKVIFFVTLIVLFLGPSSFLLSEIYVEKDSRVDFSPKTSTYSSINLKNLPQIDYSALNETWYNPKVEMLIVSPNKTEFINALEPLRNWKNEKGVKTVIVSNYSEYEGRDKAEKIRNLIKDYYENEGIRWVLLAGDAEENLIPIRYVYNPDTVIYHDSESVGNAYQKPTDFYYADLTGSWDQDNDGTFGESSKYNANGVDEIDWIPEVYVGRFPAGNAEELEIMVNKTINYEMNPTIGDWMNKMLLAGAVSDTTYQEPPDGEDEARLTEFVWKNYVLDEMNFTHLRNAVGFTPETPPAPNDEDSLTQAKFINEINSGYSTVLFAGHGNPTTYDGRVASTIYSSSNAQAISNDKMLSLIYGDACTTASYDENDNNIGETLIKKENAGAIGYIGALRVTWYFTNDYKLVSLNRGNAKLFWKEFFEYKKFQQGRALFDSKITYMNSEYFKENSSIFYEYQRKNLLTYSLLGDPEVDIYTKPPVNVKDTIPNQVYEAQLVEFTITNSRNKPVPFGRVFINTSNGKSQTVYADINGDVKFRLPLGANETYELKITGHNLIPTSFNFTTLPDNESPELKSYSIPAQHQSVSNNPKYTISTYDNKSGIECVMILMSKDEFNHYNIYQTRNEFNSNEDLFEFELNKLDPGIYSYVFLIRDYSNHTVIINNQTFTFSIAQPITNYFLNIGVFSSIAVIGIAIFLLIYQFKQYSYSTEQKG